MVFPIDFDHHPYATLWLWGHYLSRLPYLFWCSQTFHSFSQYLSWNSWFLFHIFLIFIPYFHFMVFWCSLCSLSAIKMKSPGCRSGRGLINFRNFHVCYMVLYCLMYCVRVGPYTLHRCNVCCVCFWYITDNMCQSCVSIHYQISDLIRYSAALINILDKYYWNSILIPNTTSSFEYIYQYLMYLVVILIEHFKLFSLFIVLCVYPVYDFYIK